MKRLQFFRVLFFVFFLLVAVCFLFLPPDFQFIARFLRNSWNDVPISDIKKETTFRRFHNGEQEYYHALSLRDTDYEAARDILLRLVDSPVSNRMKKKALSLLSEISYFNADYDFAREVLWDLLTMEPKNYLYRNNYEFVTHIVEAEELMLKEQSIKKKIEEIETNGSDAATNLQMVQKPSVYFLLINEDTDNSDLPQW